MSASPRHVLPKLALPSLLVLAALTAQADEPAKDGNENKDGWKARAGVGVIVKPEYDGAKDYRTLFTPMGELSWRRGWFEIGTSGINAWAIDTPDWQLGLRVGYDGGRDEKKGNGPFAGGSDKLRGMGKLDGTVEAGMFAEWSGLGAPISLEVMRAPRNKGHGGTHGKLGLSLPMHQDKELQIAAQLGVDWGDQRYNQAYYGVTALQASRTGRPVYTPKSGLNHFTAGLTGNWMLDQHWGVTGMVGYSRLLGDAAKSPLTERKSGPVGMLGIGYNF